MSLVALLDRLEPYCKGWERTGTQSLITLIQQGQDQLLSSNAWWRRWIGTDNKGFPPYLTTVAGTYEYEITAANLTNVSSISKTIYGSSRTVRAKDVISVFVDYSQSDYTKRWVGQPYVYHWPNPYASSSDRTELYQIPVDSYPVRENDNAKIVFLEDPGSSTTKYFCEFTWEAPRLTSESIPLVTEEEFEDALEYYVLGKVQMFANGKPNDFMALFERRKNEYYSYKDSVAKSDNDMTVRISC